MKIEISEKDLEQAAETICNLYNSLYKDENEEDTGEFDSEINDDELGCNDEKCSDKIKFEPYYEIQRKEDKDVVLVFCTGHSKDSISVASINGILTITGKKVDVEYLEMPFDSAFEIKLEYSDDDDMENTSSIYKDGLLIVIVPKKKKFTKKFEIN